ncbi:MAG: sigma-70 family RNA polymerase sigma factor [Clostridia bacterium]|nr:sigma-70 family RNA polymerase sigma factor [Clostridia bacterium]
MKENEIEEIIEYFSDTIRAISRKYFLVGGNNEDLFQEGMIGLIEACRSFDESKGDYKSEQFKRFALVCIKRQILDAIRKANAKKNGPLNNYVSFHQKNSEDEDFELEFSTIVDDGADPETQVIREETTDEQIRLLKDKLSKAEMSVLKLYLSGMKQSQMAMALNKTPKQIDNTIQRIKNKMKGKL